MTNLLTDSIIKSGDTYKNAVIFLHGYGANSNDLIGIANLWIESLPNTIFLSPNAPFECDFSSNAYQWFELTSISPDSIGDGLKKAGPYLNDYIDHVSNTFKVEEKNIFFVGFSQGTMMALYHLCKRENRCAGLLGYSGLLFENENFKSEIKSKFPIKLYHGKKDELINYQNSIEASKKLKKFGFDIDYSLSDDLGHGIDDKGIQLGLNFIKKTFNV
ncbi:MAG: dienelactone hydrolase family protein [Alphaproteobacteria bacterium]|tara:strand:+ start:192 stop:842 length:651 start_codon:yes stop_codon:yes gene_type:complete